MATITVDTYLDDGTARTPGEAWTNNGGSLIIRTDTRFHVSAPASMTGSIGNVTCSLTLGGGYKVDSTKVREVYFSGGSGTVPAIGTTISQGGVSGYLLGVWPNLTSAPTTPGGAMPATGFIKFREVTGGTFAAGVLTGITATATGDDAVSWLEIVHDQGTTLTMAGLGDGFVTDGLIWIAGTTTGAPGQQVQFPTNGGGTGTLIPAVLIETSPGSGVYEPYQALYGAANGWANTYLMNDQRAKFVQAMDNGGIRIGSDGTNNCGYTPVAGCKIATYNIFLRQCTTAARASNAQPHATLTTRPKITPRGCTVSIANTVCDWYLSVLSANSLDVNGFFFFDAFAAISVNNPINLLNIASGLFSAQTAHTVSLQGVSYDKISASLSSRLNTLSTSSIRTDVITPKNGLSYITLKVSCGLGIIRTSQAYAVIFSNSDILSSNISISGGALNISGGESSIDNIDYIDRLESSTNTSIPQNSIRATGTKKAHLNNITFGLNGLLNNCNPYSSVVTGDFNSDLRVYNISDISNILNYSNNPNYLFLDSGYNKNVYLKRCYINTRTSISSLTVSSDNIRVYDCYGLSSNNLSLIISRNNYVSGCGFTYSQIKKSAVFGFNYIDGFNSNTDGHITLAYNTPTSEFLPYITGSGYLFDINGGVVLANIGNWIEIETQYFVIKHDSFKNLSPVFLGTNTGNLSIEYHLDTGSGYGSYNTLSGANLSAETISPSSGFKLSIRATCTTAAPDNTLQYITILTNSSLTSQTNNLYPLNTAKISISGLASGTNTIFVYDVTNSVELINTTATTTTFEQYTIYNSDAVLQVRVMQATSTTAKILYETLANFTIDGAVILVSQVDDPIYAANGIDGFSQTGFIIDDATLTISINKPGTGSPTLSHVTWQEAYAAETAWLTTAAGIRHFPRVLFASDTANYKLLNGFKIKNTGLYPLIISGGYGVSGTTGLASDILDYSGGPITTVVEHVVPYQISSSGGSGLTTLEHNQLMSLPTNPLLTNDTRLNNLDTTISSRMATFAYTAPDNTTIGNINAKTTQLTFTGSNVNANSQVVSDKTGYGLTSVERESIATVVESHLLDEADGKLLVNTIVGAIGNQNIDQIALVAAIRSDLERTGGKLINLDSTVSSVLTAVNLRPTNPLLTNDTRLNNLSNLDVAISSRLANSDYVLPNNASIVAIKLKTDNLPSDPASNSSIKGLSNKDLSQVYDHSPTIDLTGIATTSQLNSAVSSIKGVDDKDISQISLSGLTTEEHNKLMSINTNVAATLTITNLVLGSDIVILNTGTENPIALISDVVSHTFYYDYLISRNVDIVITKPGYLYYRLNNYLLPTSNSTLNVEQIVDPNYIP